MSTELTIVQTQLATSSLRPQDAIASADRDSKLGAPITVMGLWRECTRASIALHENFACGSYVLASALDPRVRHQKSSGFVSVLQLRSCSKRRCGTGTARNIIFHRFWLQLFLKAQLCSASRFAQKQNLMIIVQPTQGTPVAMKRKRFEHV